MHGRKYQFSTIYYLEFIWGRTIKLNGLGSSPRSFFMGPKKSVVVIDNLKRMVRFLIRRRGMVFGALPYDYMVICLHVFR